MRIIKMDIGEIPQPGKFYLCKNHPLEVYKTLEELLLDEDEDYYDREPLPKPCASIPKGTSFMFAGVAHEQKISGQIKRVWFYVVHSEMTGIVYNGQIPFHQFLLRVEPETGLEL